MNLATTISMLAPSFAPILHAIFTVPNIALSNAMACRVYRQLKLGILIEKPLPRESQVSAPIQLRQPTVLAGSSSSQLGYGYGYARYGPGMRNVDVESAIVPDGLVMVDKIAIEAVSGFQRSSSPLDQAEKLSS